MNGGVPPSLAGAAWLAAPGVRRVFAALDRDGDETRIIGGAVRDALAGLPVGDVDFATTAAPATVMRRGAEAGLKPVPTGIEHGTVTLVADRVGYEVTTLREDVETDGRHAVVRFGRDWHRDAARRDFTVNALSVDAEGRVHDPLGAYPDVLARRIRFIGAAGRRIAEDRLRILRFFRFNAQFGNDDAYEPEGLAAAIRARDGIRDLSRERIGQEMRRLLVAPRAAEALAAMQDGGILAVILAGIAYLGPFARLLAFGTATGAALPVPLRLAAAACRIEEDVERVAARLRLANAERDLMRAIVATARHVPSPDDERAARRLRYEVGDDAFRGAVALAFAWSADDEGGHARLHRLPGRWPRPEFPLSGSDALGAGLAPGPAVGSVLAALEAWWIAEDFAPDRDALRVRLRELVAAAR